MQNPQYAVKTYKYDPKYATTPPEHHAAVTPSDSVNFDVPCRELYIGSTGDIVVISVWDESVTYVNALAGTTLSGVFKRVDATGTTASNIVARW